NIRAIEHLTGVDVIIDDTPQAVVLSSFDGIRREVAKLTLTKLIEDGRIHPARIEEMYYQSKAEIDEVIRQAGEQAVFEANCGELHEELVKILGRLRFRTSYGQNVEAVLLIAADAISASRPGARGESLEQYIKRLEALEEVAARHPGVEKVYALQAGREIRVLVKPKEIDDDAAVLLSHEIAR